MSGTPFRRRLQNSRFFFSKSVRSLFQVEPPHIGHYRDYPPPPTQINVVWHCLQAFHWVCLLLGLRFIHDMWWLYHRAQRSYFWPSILQLILLIAQIAFVYSRIILKITRSCDHNTNLVKYYPMLFLLDGSLCLSCLACHLAQKGLFSKCVARQVKFISAGHWRTFYQVFNMIELWFDWSSSYSLS